VPQQILISDAENTLQVKLAERRSWILQLKLFTLNTMNTFKEARKREAQIKCWSRAKKDALICGDLEKLKNLSKSQRSR